MRLVTFEKAGATTLGVRRGSEIVNLAVAAPELPTDLTEFLVAGESAMERAHSALEHAPADSVQPLDSVHFLPPVTSPGKILCLGLNYSSHAEEVGATKKLDYPIFFTRFRSTLVGHGQPMIRPRASEQFDYEGELVAVIGRTTRHVSKAQALESVAGYSVFNDGSLRDFQMRTRQWTVGKNFDATGGFGPEFVTADELPPGGAGLRLTTRLNGDVLQNGNTDELIFDVAEIISVASECMTLEAGDLLVTGTPAGVGFTRDPPIFMKAGDLCEVEIEGIGTLANPIEDEA